MAKIIPAASAATLAALLIASPALAQTIIAPAPAPMVIAPAPRIVTVPEPVTSYEIAPDIQTVAPLTPVGVAPAYPPVTAVPSGPSPTDPSEYATESPIMVTGHVDSVMNGGSYTSFRLQTPTEAWTVVVPLGQGGSIGRSATVVGYPHVEVRNQLLAQSVTANR